ncbi:unnamed protein product [marine sediment metagenome]|uniref:YprB ribonuclease H-like domain-containing protein n=1 Tax=marine sediment metagenome TaxID=412755 RepID=X1AY87_9ZZZZ
MININKLTKQELKDRLKFKCKHRHNGLTHPECYIDEDMRVCYLDIESTALTATFGMVLSTAIKERDNPNIMVSKFKFGLTNGFDRPCIQSTVDILKQFDVVVTYYGGDYRFDIPMIRTKADEYNISFPEYGDMVSIDLYTVVKKKYKLHSNRLDVACRINGIQGKTHLDPKIWKAAMFGDPGALEYVVEHNKQDVVILEKLHKRLEKYMPVKKSSI